MWTQAPDARIGRSSPPPARALLLVGQVDPRRVAALFTLGRLSDRHVRVRVRAVVALDVAARFLRCVSPLLDPVYYYTACLPRRS